MALPQPTAPFTAEDYLRWEAGQPDKHEYDHGETFAMGGASRRHVTISLNIAAALDEALEGSPCRAYIADMKVQAAADEAYFYPDLRRIEHYRRSQDERWELQDIEPEQALVLESLEVSIPWQKVFRNAD